MDLPEISSLISGFLTANDLARCMRVCHQWQFIFRPALYRDKVELHSVSGPKHLSVEIASRHGHFMHTLKCCGEIRQDYLSIPSITHLTELVLMSGSDGREFKATYWDAVVALIRRNPRLTVLRLMSALWPPVPLSEEEEEAGGDDDHGGGLVARRKARTLPKRDHFWDAVVEHPNLKRLTIMNNRWARIQPYTTSFWHAISKIESLTLIYCSLSQTNSPHVVPLPDGLSPKLKMFLQAGPIASQLPEMQQQLQYLTLCSHLERLFLPVTPKTVEDFPTALFLRAISERVWPNLQELEMPNLNFQDHEWVQILDGLQKGHRDHHDASSPSSFSPTYSTSPWTATGLKKLIIGGVRFGSGALQSLAAHFSTLTVLQLTGGQERASLVMQRALESCPKLVTIVGDLLYVSDMVRGKPWICGSSLNSFSIDIVLDLEERAFQEYTKVMEFPAPPFTLPKTVQLFVYGQLARMTQLRVLNLRSVPPPKDSDCEGVKDPPRRLDLDLEHGLGELATLTRLRHLEFRHVQNMTFWEVEWMGFHWRRLERITGEMNEDLDKQCAMRPFLQRLNLTQKYTTSF